MFTETLKKHCNLEFEAAQMYLAVSLSASQAGFFGLAKWCGAESQDEISHGHKILKLLRDVYGVDCKIDAGDFVVPKTKSFDGLIKILLDGEWTIADSITNLLNKPDCVAINTLLELANIQRDSIEYLTDLYNRARSAVGDDAAILNLDQNLENYYVITECPVSN